MRKDGHLENHSGKRYLHLRGNNGREEVMEVECIGLTRQLAIEVKGRGEKKMLTTFLVSLNC